MSDGAQPYRAFSADGHSVRWNPWNPSATGEHEDDLHQVLSLAWENEAWTATGNVGLEQVQYVMRISPTWHVRQLLLFRDMEDPDLWLGTDGHGQWGEMNGAHRPELDGCIDVELTCTPFTHTIPIRRLPLHVGDAAEITVASIDVETLDVQPVHRRYTRLTANRWKLDSLTAETSIEFNVDDFGLVNNFGDRFRRHV